MFRPLQGALTRGRYLQTRPPRRRDGGAFEIWVPDATLGHSAVFAVGDIIHARAWDGTAERDNHWRILSIRDPGAAAGGIYYDALRVNGSAATFPAGTPLIKVSSATAGKNFISLSADGQIGAAPNITIGQYTTSPWASPTVLARLGNLNGIGGEVSDVIGFLFGDYSSGNYIKGVAGGTFSIKAANGGVDIDANGIRILEGAAAQAWLQWHDGAGNTLAYLTDELSAGVNSVNLSLPSYTATKSLMYITAASPSTYEGGINLTASSGSHAVGFNVRTANGTYPAQLYANSINLVSGYALPFLQLLPGAWVAAAASTEVHDIDFHLARTNQFATGALALQRAFRVRRPAYSFVGASTLSLAVTMEIDDAPAAGANATITSKAALRIAAGSLVVGSAALPTNATSGFHYIPTCAGTPTGTPETHTGTVPLIYDTTNNKLYAYNGAWKSVTLA